MENLNIFHKFMHIHPEKLSFIFRTREKIVKLSENSVKFKKLSRNTAKNIK